MREIKYVDLFGNPIHGPWTTSYKGNQEVKLYGDEYKPVAWHKHEESDQTNKADGGKIKPRLLIDDMALAMQHVAAVLTYGAEKYEERGWRKVDKERYEDAQYRHHLALASGESHDDESGLHHLAHIACNSMFLLQMELERLGYPKPKWNRPPQDHKDG